MSTAEAIATTIQAGDSERITELWEQVQAFVSMRAFSYSRQFRASPVDISDLIQEGFLALLQCVQSWEPAGGRSFLGYLNFYLRARWRQLYGANGKADALDRAESLDEPIGEEGDTVLGDLIPDPAAEAAFDAKEAEIYVESLHQTLDAALDHAPNGDILRRRYLYGETGPEIAEALGCATAKIHQMEREAMRYMRNSKYTKMLKEFDCYHGTGYQMWKETGMSIQERYLMR